MSTIYGCVLIIYNFIIAVACAEGCTPRITGLPLQSRFTFPSSNATQTVLADYNSYECGRRGKCDYTTGTI
jgi:hypothetical protein